MCQKRKLISRRSVLKGAAAGAAAFTFAPILGHRSVFGGSPGIGNNKFLVVLILENSLILQMAMRLIIPLWLTFYLTLVVSKLPMQLASMRLTLGLLLMRQRRSD